MKTSLALALIITLVSAPTFAASEQDGQEPHGGNAICTQLQDGVIYSVDTPLPACFTTPTFAPKVYNSYENANSYLLMAMKVEGADVIIPPDSYALVDHAFTIKANDAYVITHRDNNIYLIDR